MTRTELERVLATTLQHRAEDAMSHTDTQQQLDELVIGLERDAGHRRRSGVAAGLVAAAAAVAAAVFWWPNGDDAQPSPAPPSPSESVTRAEMVSRQFVAAYSAFDPERAVSYLTRDAYIAGFGAPRGVDSLQRANRLMQATGFRVQDVDCSQTGTLATGAERVGCLVTAHDMGSDLLGRGPDANYFFELHVRDDRIEVAMLTFIDAPSAFEDKDKEPEPFWIWLWNAHPEDERLLDAWGDPSADPATVDRSLRLWERRVEEYIDAVQAGEAE